MRIAVAAALLWLAASSSAFAKGGLEGFLSQLNVEAHADLDSFVAKVGAQFEIPEAQVRVVLSAVSDPADAFMVFQVGQFAHRSSEQVLPVYKAQKGKGWGVIAKELGIKPGSPEFHALKNGNLQLTGVPGAAPGGHGNGRGRGHGHGNGNGPGRP